MKLLKWWGPLLLKKLLQKVLNKVVFDRGGQIYHGRVKALADCCQRKWPGILGKGGIEMKRIDPSNLN